MQNCRWLANSTLFFLRRDVDGRTCRVFSRYTCPQYFIVQKPQVSTFVVVPRYNISNSSKYYITDSLTVMVKLYLLQSLTTSPKGRLMKYFTALNMLNVLLLSSSYSSGLSSVMTVPRYKKAIKTVKDLASSGLPWGAPTDAWLISLREVNEVTTRKQNP